MLIQARVNFKADGKNEGRVLSFPFEHVDFYEAGAGLTGIILVLPAGLTRPAPAEHALAQL